VFVFDGFLRLFHEHEHRQERGFYYPHERNNSMKKMRRIIWGHREGFIYLGCDASRSAYKIGMTIDPIARQREIRKMNPTFVIFSTVMVYNRWEAEKFLHDYFSEKRIDGEWFTLNYDDIRQFFRLLAPEEATWKHLIDKRYSNDIIEQRIAVAFSGGDYDAIIGDD
jgi:hypothetical protein